LDNITHTLVGAALAEAGLRKRTALGAATLMIGANFPDIDALAIAFGKNLEFRRGPTHGFLALVILPWVLAGIMWLWDSQVRRRRDPSLPPADYRQLALLSAIAILTHPTLDYMNTYGMRWLMPFVDKWFYADGLFIVDPWFMLTLATGVAMARRLGSTRPARLALIGATGYVLAMLAITKVGETNVALAYRSVFMVEPTPLVPWRRDVLVDDGDAYQMGRYHLFRGVTMDRGSIAKGDKDPAVGLARETAAAQRFLSWSRFPFYRVVRDRDGTLVRIADARYMEDHARGWAAIEIRLPVSPRLASGPAPLP
jgi:inner membrane protein